MAKVKYTGTADVRKILKQDFQGVGIEDQGAVQFDAGNQFTAEVSQSAEKYLTEHDTFDSVTTDESPTTAQSKSKSKS